MLSNHGFYEVFKGVFVLFSYEKICLRSAVCLEDKLFYNFIPCREKKMLVKTTWEPRLGISGEAHCMAVLGQVFCLLFTAGSPAVT